MPILSKGTTFTSPDTVTSTKLNNLVDAATFAAGAVDDSTTALSGGAIIVKNAGITPTKLSTGAPTWNGSGNLTVSGTLTTGGTISTSNDLAVNGIAAINGAISIGNTVNTVSPTSPDRTITIVVGGTTYYLHAKTTND
jgi:hypothetical protein